jgi:uncharacterized protein YaaR (DUF327 family)
MIDEFQTKLLILLHEIKNSIQSGNAEILETIKLIDDKLEDLKFIVGATKMQ